MINHDSFHVRVSNVQSVQPQMYKLLLLMSGHDESHMSHCVIRLIVMNHIYRNKFFLVPKGAQMGGRIFDCQ